MALALELAQLAAWILGPMAAIVALAWGFGKLQDWWNP